MPDVFFWFINFPFRTLLMVTPFHYVLSFFHFLSLQNRFWVQSTFTTRSLSPPLMTFSWHSHWITLLLPFIPSSYAEKEKESELKSEYIHLDVGRVTTPSRVNDVEQRRTTTESLSNLSAEPCHHPFHETFVAKMRSPTWFSPCK